MPPEDLPLPAATRAPAAFQVVTANRTQHGDAGSLDGNALVWQIFHQNRTSVPIGAGFNVGVAS